MARAGGLAMLLVPCAIALLTPTGSNAQTVNPDLWGINYTNVTAMARSGNTLYVGGAFSHVGPNTGSGVPLDYGIGNPSPDYAKVNGEIFAAITDRHGGWFIGGNFTAVGGRPRKNLAHLFPSGQVDNWSADANRPVHALALSGATLYVGGEFDSIGGCARSLLAAVDAASGATMPWSPNPAEVLAEIPVVSTLAVRSDTVYIGGNFLKVGGMSRPYLTAVDAGSGLPFSWSPLPSYRVRTMTLSGNSAFVGGRFVRIGGQPRALAAGVDLTTGLATTWDPHITDRRRQYWEDPPEVMALLVREGKVFIGGLWDSLGGQYRCGLGAVDATTGALSPWAPLPGGGFPYTYVRALAARGDTIYVGGYFSKLHSEPRVCLAGVDAVTGIPTAWNPRPNDEVNAVALDDDHIYAAGNLCTLGPWKTRFNLAAIDLTTGLPTDWNPDPNGLIVYSIAVKDGVVYAGGDFTQVGGQSRSGIAALDAVSGVATAWNPSANGAVGALVVRGDTIYAGGGFTQIGGQPRRHLAALDAATGLATLWDPNAGNGATIEAMILHDDTMYVAGNFVTMGPEVRSSFAAVDANTGNVLPWRADLKTGWINDMTLNGRILYVVGKFDTIAGQPRTSAAAVDRATGALQAWNPGPVRVPDAVYGPPQLYAVAAMGRDVFIGGQFSAVGGAPRTGLAVVDDSLGIATSWDPRSDEIVWSLKASGTTLFVGGKFRTINGLPTARLAEISFPTPPAPPSPAAPPLALAQSFPNPARASAVIHFSLPAPGPVTLEIFDIQGRKVATLLDHEKNSAGDHDILVRPGAWGSGAYFYRLEAAGRSATRKMMVIE